jgi:hypothetical protein
MKANPGGTVTGEGIIGRSEEIDALWATLRKRSAVISAERRVGKTSMLRKMAANPRSGQMPLLVIVESAHHPIDCVEAMYTKAAEANLRSSQGIWSKRLSDTLTAASGGQIGGWKLPAIQQDWRRLLRVLVEDIVEHSETGAVFMIDEFPLMVWNIKEEHGAQLAMQTMDALREIRQEFESTDRIRFVLSGSIGLHLVLQELKQKHGYRGAPVNDMQMIALAGMSADDVELMCQKYLDEEKIERRTPAAVAERMLYRTDGLPLYIQYVCEEVQNSNARTIGPDDIDRVLDEMLDGRQTTWFKDAADRIPNYYAKFGIDGAAAAILDRLSREEDYFAEGALVDTVRTADEHATRSDVQRVLETLLDDNYLVRDTSTGERRYRFRYRLMRQWWRINKA